MCENGYPIQSKSEQRHFASFTEKTRWAFVTNYEFVPGLCTLKHATYSVLKMHQVIVSVDLEASRANYGLMQMK